MIGTQPTAEDLLRPLTAAWQGKIRLAQQKKNHAEDSFGKVAEQCMGFFSGATDFMWRPEYMRRFMGGMDAPVFRITLARAFELVALFGPWLYFQNPIRTVKPHDRAELEPDLFGDPNDPQVQAAYQQMTAQDRQEQARIRLACKLNESYLSYTPQEQPGGGLQQASEDAITEALIKGRGVLWPEPYVMPGSNRKLTGCFYDSVDNLLVDPDARSITFGECRWIAREFWEPTWQAERRFKLPEGTLKRAGHRESSDAMAATAANENGAHERQVGHTYDMVKYYRIWSLGGVGTRLTGAPQEFQNTFDRHVGDFAHIVVCPGVPYPLNAYPPRFQTATPDEVRRMFSWPVPYWLDDRWPCAILDFYRKPGSAWPMAPIGPGLGELTAMNVLLSCLCQRVWNKSFDVLGVLDAVKTDVDTAMKKPVNGRIVLALGRSLQDIRKVMQFMPQPGVPLDDWRLIDALAGSFDKRTGLTELHYAMNPGGVASRTATDMQVKENMASVRPDEMGRKVSAWMGDNAAMEKLCAYWSGVGAADVLPLMGPMRANLYEQLVTNADPEMVLREMECTVEAESTRRPNKARDMENIGQIFPAAVAELSKHADATTDTGPINGLFKQWGEASQQDVRPIVMGPRQPPPPPPDQSMEQQAQQQMQIEQAQFEAEQGRKQQEHDQKIDHTEEAHDAKLEQQEEQAQQKVDTAKMLGEVKARVARMMPKRPASGGKS
jgi:hypothetical protein